MVKDQKSEEWETIGFVSGNGNSNSPKDYTFVDNNPSAFGNINYRLKQIDNDGQYEFSNVISVNYLLNGFQLYQNYPNPFNPITTISWQSEIDGNTSIIIYDVLGSEVAQLINEYKPAGKYEIEFSSSNSGNTTSLPSGVYIYKIEIKNNESLYTMNRKMTLLK